MRGEAGNKVERKGRKEEEIKVNRVKRRGREDENAGV